LPAGLAVRRYAVVFAPLVSALLIVAGFFLDPDMCPPARLPRAQAERRQKRREANRGLKRQLARVVFNPLRASPTLT
jgi:hypothetical protein